jgi:glutaredoxin 3
MRILLACIAWLCASAYLPATEASTIANGQHQPQLLLYYSPSCPYCHRVLNYLKSIHKTVPLRNVITDKSAKKDLIKLGGKPQVPCLIIDGQALYESEDIVNWLSQHQSALDNT